jgi:hypothetical protein
VFAYRQQIEYLTKRTPSVMAKYHSSCKFAPGRSKLSHLTDRLPDIETSPFFRKTTRMPSPRRVRIFGILIFLGIVTFLLWSASTRQRRLDDTRTTGDFYAKTLNALDQLPESPRSADTEDSQEVSRAMAERLQEAAQLAKDKANAKAPKPDPPSELVGVGSSQEGARDGKSIAGRKKYQPAGAQEPLESETQEDHDVELELNSILKKSPGKSSSWFCTVDEPFKCELISVYSNSNHILEVLLPALATRQGHSS